MKRDLCMRSALLGDSVGDFDTSEGTMRFLRGAIERGTGWRKSLKVVVVAMVTATNNRCKHLGISIPGKGAAASACGPCSPAAVAVAVGREDVWEKLREKGSSSW